MKAGTALAPDKVNLTALATEKRIESKCDHCGIFIGVVGARFDLPAHVAWVRVRCTKCGQWNAFDIATGKPFRRAA